MIKRDRTIDVFGLRAAIVVKAVRAAAEVMKFSQMFILASLAEPEGTLDEVTKPTKPNSLASDKINLINLNLREASGELSFGTAAG